jgi:hypothetical protein
MDVTIEKQLLDIEDIDLDNDENIDSNNDKESDFGDLKESPKTNYSSVIREHGGKMLEKNNKSILNII